MRRPQPAQSDNRFSRTVTQFVSTSWQGGGLRPHSWLGGGLRPHSWQGGELWPHSWQGGGLRPHAPHILLKLREVSCQASESYVERHAASKNKYWALEPDSYHRWSKTVARCFAQYDLWCNMTSGVILVLYDLSRNFRNRC